MIDEVEGDECFCEDASCWCGQLACQEKSLSEVASFYLLYIQLAMWPS
jgi:hypothetical protein